MISLCMQIPLAVASYLTTYSIRDGEVPARPILIDPLIICEKAGQVRCARVK